MKLKASVIICSYLPERINFLLEAIESIDKQTYFPIEVIIIIDGSQQLFDKMSFNISDKKIILNPKNIGLSLSRNIGARYASGNVIIFFDDDATADPNWVSEIMNIYKNHNAIAVGGRINPDWMNNKKEYIPDEYLWLLGASHKGTPENIIEVDNTFGSNISFLRDVFINLGGFKPNLGFSGKKMLQGEELELCSRMKETYGRGVVYNPNAIVYHKVFGDRTKIKTLIIRSFWQGYSKRQIQENSKIKLTTENKFLKDIFFNAIPNKIYQLILLFLLTLSVGAGYLYRMIRK